MPAIWCMIHYPFKSMVHYIHCTVNSSTKCSVYILYSIQYSTVYHHSTFAVWLSCPVSLLVLLLFTLNSLSWFCKFIERGKCLSFVFLKFYSRFKHTYLSFTYIIHRQKLVFEYMKVGILNSFCCNQNSVSAQSSGCYVQNSFQQINLKWSLTRNLLHFFAFFFVSTRV